MVGPRSRKEWQETFGRLCEGNMSGGGTTENRATLIINVSIIRITYNGSHACFDDGDASSHLHSHPLPTATLFTIATPPTPSPAIIPTQM